MACAYANFKWLVRCQKDAALVLAITGQTFSALNGSSFRQEVNMMRLFDDVKVDNQEVISLNQIQMPANEACRHALNQRGVSHITFPIDYQPAIPDEKPSIHNQKKEMTLKTVDSSQNQEIRREESWMRNDKFPGGKSKMSI